PRLTRTGTDARLRLRQDAMTSAQTMLNRVITLSMLASMLAVLTACSMTKERDPLTPPGVIVSPYDATQGDVLWAVIPPLNESGTSIADSARIGDAIIAAVQEARGIRCLPLNRSIDAMRSLGFVSGIETSSDAHQIAEFLGADAIVVGSITAYDPYDPPVLGLALALYARPGAMAQASKTSLDTRMLTSAFTDFGTTSGLHFAGEPVSVVSEHLDGRNHEVQYAARTYAQGRSERQSAMQWRIYLASMDLYTEFAAHHTVGRLIDEEWLRLSRQPVSIGAYD
ncbi:MAG: hypothetical protein NXI07_12895, partial [bacterium]|nr:hypothetical protein [bacterium]